MKLNSLRITAKLKNARLVYWRTVSEAQHATYVLGLAGLHFKNEERGSILNGHEKLTLFTILRAPGSSG
jgi:hypothetical protein